MASSGSVNLSVHRNTRDQRRRHAVSKRMIRSARVMAREKWVAGYALVAWTKNGEEYVCAWDDGGLQINLLPDYVRGAMRRKLASIDVENQLNGAPEDDAA